MQFDPSAPEALDWLRATTHPFGLGGERFRTKQEALRFVEWLYRLGAERVVVPREFIRADPFTLQHEGGPCAAALVVRLPAEPEKREPLVWLCALEMGFRGTGGVRSEDALAQYVGSREVFLSWK